MSAGETPGHLPPSVRRFTTDCDLPLHQAAYQSPLRDERLAAYLGASLGVLFSLCFVTGLYSHLQQHPQSWLPIPARPAGLYRLTQGIHVASGIASVPVLIAKLWLVWPRFVALPPVKRASHLVERVSLFPLVGGGIFMVFSGVANIAQWYPWRFSFTAAHFWMAWVTIGALVAHVGAKWAISRRALTRPSRRPLLAEPDPVLGTVADRAAAGGSGLSRRGFLGTVATASGVLTVATVGQAFPPLRPLALLAPRDPAFGPQGHPVNRGAVNAGVVDLARSPDYRLTVGGLVTTPLSFDRAELLALPSHEAHLPIACVEGWSFSAAWSGIRVRDLLARAGAARGRTVLVESLEPIGAYRTSTLDPDQAADRDTLLATHLDGQLLAIDHGFPCRLIAPNRAGVLQTKWVTKVTVL
ncbi:MAG TPA: molybdopterin-dependent oxidoreductase [Acidimicrobiales bacterium]|nr:molybdopterin-dependent oxidoreductase [Acidimicrobiales bacterium]